MVLKRQIIALGAVVLVGGLWLPLDEALAFGQQWRPAPGYGVGSGANLRPTSNVPAFRPHSAARPAIARRLPRVGPPAYPQYPYAGRLTPHFAPRQGAPLWSYGRSPVGGFMPPPGHLAAVYPQAALSRPFVPAASPWGWQMPMFTRQFGWRPARQPWVAQTPAPRWQDYRSRITPPAVQQRPVRTAYVPAAGSWRPTAPGAASPRQFIARSPAHAGIQRPIFRLPSQTLNPAQSTRLVAAVAAQPVAPQHYWRPQVGEQAGIRRSWQAFRPSDYGRRPPRGNRLAARGGEDGGLPRGGLPGWVTTHDYDIVEDSCNWCSGS